jgi:ATP-dependent helicase/nuclease subunit B
MRIFTIPPSAPFLRTLITALLAGRIVPISPCDDPVALAAATLYLPTRRACRLARDVFLDVCGRDAAVLPRILAIGDVDEDAFAFAETATGELADAVLELPPAIDGVERRLLLARLVLEWANAPAAAGSGGAPLVARSLAAALTLADELAQLIDDMTTRGLPWERLDVLVPQRFDPYWQLSLMFLKIAREAWPAILAERNAIEPAERRDRLIAAEAARLKSVAEGPVIAAGSTGSMPATSALLATIAQLPQGAVVLPGLDTDLDGDSWGLIAGPSDLPPNERAPVAGHPQFAMSTFLRRCGIGRESVIELVPPAAHGRERLVSEALRPAATTERWKKRLDDTVIRAALAGVAMIEAAGADEEALAIAIALREAVEAPGNTAALVTPDRALARHVVAELRRWDLAVDDSGGDALADTDAGVFARLVADAALGGVAPITLLALMKHQLFRLAAGDGQHGRAISALERSILRGPRPRSGTAGIIRALAAFRAARGTLDRPDTRPDLSEDELDDASKLVSRLATALAPLECLGPQRYRLADVAGRHRETVVSLSCDPDDEAAALAGEDGNALAAVFDEIAASSAAELQIAPADYPDLFRALIAGQAVRRASADGVRVRIFGLLEARLQEIDRIVLGGLIEGTWPPQVRIDPWLSRPMRHDLGLDLPERRIGLSTHDFVQALGAPEVILSRAAKRAGVPTVASRLVQRLAAVAGKTAWSQVIARGERYVQLARLLDRPERIEPVRAPQPRPPRAARPISLSVTDVENLLRDPYTIYAKHVLRLAPLEPVDTQPGTRDRGNVIHRAIGEFTQVFSDRLPRDPLAELLRLGRKHFAPVEDYPEVRAFWWPRFQRIARWFVGWDLARRAAISATHAEIRGEIAIPLGERSFRLIARADRIDRMADGRCAIIDYKTGEARTEKQVRTGLAPQLTLEAAILRAGGFPGFPSNLSVGELAYVVLKGGEPPGKAEPIIFAESSPDREAIRALRRLSEIVTRFDDDREPFRSLVNPMWKGRYGDYDHLARVKEWSASDGTGEAGGTE